MIIKECLKKGIEALDIIGIEDSVLKAKLLLANIIEKPKEYLFIHENEELEDEEEKEFWRQIDELSKNTPLQYLTKTQEFMGLDFYVNENVLIPRSDTEILVEEVLKNIDKSKKVRILDMCTGSGIIGISLAKICDNVEVVCVDKSDKALEVAFENAKFHGVANRIDFICSDMFGDLYDLCDRRNMKFDIIVSNPPYIETETIKTLNKDVQKEPLMALDGGEDGLDFYRIIADKAWNFLNENGKVFVEIGYNQGESVIALFKEKFNNVSCVKDLAGLDRVVIAR